MVKTLQKSSPEPAGRFPRNWFVASGTPAHHSLFKWWPWSDLGLFYGKVKFGNLGFSMGKSENSGFSETIAASDLKVSRSSHLNKYEGMWVLKVKVISWPWPKVVYIQKFKPEFADLNQFFYESFQVHGNENLMTWCWSRGRHAHIW